MLQDLRSSFRMLWKAPAFALTAILILGVGIGASSAMFSVANAVLLRPLPYRDAGALVLLWGNTVRAGVTERRGASYPDFADWRNQAKSFTGMAAFSDANFILSDPAQPDRLAGELVSANYFDILGVRPALGRVFTLEDDAKPDTHTVALIGYGLWTRRFGADPNIVGKPIHLDQQTYTIAGVLPEGFRGLTDSAQLWLPMMVIDKDAATERGSRWLQVVARLQPGVSLQQAQAEMDGISKRLATAYPKTNDQRAAEVIGLQQDLFSKVSNPVWVALGAVLLVLLIACVNVSNLLLVRGESRRQEMAVRQALGASRGRLARQLLAESAVPAFLGAAVGLALASWGTQGLLALSPIRLPSFVHVTIDARVLVFTALIALLTTVLTGLLPGLRCFRRNVNAELSSAGARSGDSRSRQRVRSALVVSEISLALVLLFAAGLLLRSFQRLTELNPGFDPSGVVTLRAVLGPQDDSGTKTAYRALALIDRLRGLPGVTAASLSSDVPLDGNANAVFYTPEGNNVVAEQKRPRAYLHRVSPGFFATLRIPLLHGRFFTPAEMASGARMVIVSQDVARRYWPGEDPIGKHLKFGAPDSQQPWLEVIGVVGDVNYRGVPKNPTPDPDLYFPLSEKSQAFALAVRSSSDPAQLQAAIREELKQFAPGAPLYDSSTLGENLAQQWQAARFVRSLMAAFAGIALLLALVGIYGVTSFAVAQRTPEIGIRMALGAQTGQIFAGVIAQTLVLTAIGVFVGAAAALGFARVLASMLYGVTATSPGVMIVVAALLLTCALLASYLPARRAMRVDPMVALRYE